MEAFKYRGKSMRTKEFVFGSLLNIESAYYIVGQDIPLSDLANSLLEVNQETIGQYFETSEGKGVYVGDILEVCLPWEIIDNNLNSLDNKYVNVQVKFEKGCFIAVPVQEYDDVYLFDFQPVKLTDLLEVIAYKRYTTTYKVIGNIYDNPDLLQPDTH